MRRFSSLCLATPVIPEPTLMFRPAVRKNWRGASLYISDCLFSNPPIHDECPTEPKATIATKNWQSAIGNRQCLHCQSAINLDDLAGDITRIVGKQETCDACYFVTLSKSTQRNLL